MQALRFVQAGRDDALAEVGPMSRRGVTAVRMIIAASAVALVVCLSAVAVPGVRQWWTGAGNSKQPANQSSSTAETKTSVQLVGDATLQLAPAVIESLGVRTGVVKKVTEGQT